MIKFLGKNKPLFLLGDFNVNHLKYDEYAPTSEFLDSLSSHIFLPNIVQPNSISTTSKTLIYNIFSNIVTPSHVSGNLTSPVSDHLPQFIIVPDIFLNSSPPKSNIYEREWNNFDQKNLILDYCAVDWADIIKSEKKNLHFSSKYFLKKFNLILDKNLPLKKLIEWNEVQNQALDYTWLTKIYPIERAYWQNLSNCNNLLWKEKLILNTNL